MRTAIFCNDTWHPAETLRPGFAALADEPFQFAWLETPAQWLHTDLGAFELIVLAKGNTTGPGDQTPWLTPAVEAALAAHVAAGRGLAVVHAGTAGYRQTATLRPLTGGGFLHHPPPCPVTVEPAGGHALTVGVTPFTAIDEHYFVELDPAIDDVFLHTQSSHGRQPAGWRRRVGPGRVWAATPGHTPDVWGHPSFHRLLRLGLRWASGLDA